MLQHFLNGNILTIKETIMGFTKDHVSFARYDISKWMLKNHTLKNENDPVMDSLYDDLMNHGSIKWCLDNYLPKVMTPEQIASLKLPEWYKEAKSPSSGTATVSLDDQPWDTRG